MLFSGFVTFHLLGGHDFVKRDFQLPRRVSEQLVINIRDDSEPKLLVELKQRCYGVVERRPTPDGAGQHAQLRLGEGYAQLRSDPFGNSAQNLAVRPPTLRLQLRFVGDVEPEKPWVLDDDAV